MRRFELGDLAPPWRWGIFQWRPCDGTLIEQSSLVPELMVSLYATLKKMGFRETRWQVVYPDQIGGLIRNRRGSLLEIHVRFYKGDMIYAELEVGRSALLHFTVEPVFANNYLRSLLRSRVTPPELDYLVRATETYKATSRKRWREWSAKGKFMTPSLKRKIRASYILGDWRVLMVAMLVSVAAVFADDAEEIAVVALIMIIVYILAPKRS